MKYKLFPTNFFLSTQTQFSLVIENYNAGLACTKAYLSNQKMKVDIDQVNCCTPVEVIEVEYSDQIPTELDIRT